MPEQEAAPAVVTATLLASYTPGRQQCWCIACAPPEGTNIPTLERHGETLSEALSNLSEAIEEWEDEASLAEDEDVPEDEDDEYMGDVDAG